MVLRDNLTCNDSLWTYQESGDCGVVITFNSTGIDNIISFDCELLNATLSGNINNHIYISVPKKLYSGGNFLGDDTTGFTLRRINEKVVFNREVGTGTLNFSSFDSTNIPDSYSWSNQLLGAKTIIGTHGIFYYDLGPRDAFRGGKGLFFYKDNNTYHFAMSVDFNKDYLNEVIELLGSV